MLNCTRWLAIEAAAVTAPAPAEQTRSSCGSTGQVTRASQRSHRADALFRRLHWAGYTGVTALQPSRQRAGWARVRSSRAVSGPTRQTSCTPGVQSVQCSPARSRSDTAWRRPHHQVTTQSCLAGAARHGTGATVPYRMTRFFVMRFLKTRVNTGKMSHWQHLTKKTVCFSTKKKSVARIFSRNAF